MSRNEKRKLERWLAKQPKDTRKLVDVIRLEDTEKGQVPIFAFMTYGWTFPLYWSQQGKIKSGISNNPSDNGSIRMKQACSQKTPIAEQPRVIKELKQVWEIPMELVGLDKSKANRIRNRFDQECNKRLSKYKVKDGTAPLVGEEWYREISINDIKKLRLEVWNELLVEYGTKLIEKEYKKLKPRGLQEPAIKAIIEALKNEVSRFKGIAPTGFGKTVVAFLTIVKAINLGLLKNRVVMMTAPNQFLANKNAASFDDYGRCNGVKNLVNIPVFSGSDLGFLEDNIAVLERKDKLANIISAYLNDNPDNVIVLHTCNPSVELVDEVLDMIGINEIDFAICDEAHTLASTYDSRWNYVLEDHRVKINSRFFLTATEKTLANPDFLEHVPNRGDRVAKFNYMNNKEVFGGYAFKFSFAQGVDAGHIVPMIAKVFEYSNNHIGVIEMMSIVDALDIPELEEVRDDNGLTFEYDKKFIRDIVSILALAGKESRKKILSICSRNARVSDLVKVLKALQNTGNYLQGFEITDIKACDYLPAERQDLLDNIHDSDKNQIIVTGPWAITGVDCPSIDAVHWTFTPGSEISITQGTGRGARLHEGKQNVMVSFNLDIDNLLTVIRSKVSSTIVKLYEAQFPSHDVELRERVRRRIGRRFASVDKDTSGDINPTIRMSIDQIHEATEGNDLISFLYSLSPRITEEDMDLIVDLFCTQNEIEKDYDATYIKNELIRVSQSILKHKKISLHQSKALEEKIKYRGYTIIKRFAGFSQYLPELATKISKEIRLKHSLKLEDTYIFNPNQIKDKKVQKDIDEIIKSYFIGSSSNGKKGTHEIVHKRVCEYLSCMATDKRTHKSINDKSHTFLTVIFQNKDSEKIRKAIIEYYVSQYGTIKSLNEFRQSFVGFLNSIPNKYGLNIVFKPGISKFKKEDIEGRSLLKKLIDELTKNVIGRELFRKLVVEEFDSSYKKSDEHKKRVKSSWTPERRAKQSKITSKRNKEGLARDRAEKGSMIKVECPDGYVTSKNHAKRYCKNKGLDYSKCKELDKIIAK